MDQIKEHIRLLSIFHYVVGGLTALCSFIPIIHLVMGIAMLIGAFPPNVDASSAQTAEDEMALKFVGIMFTAFASVFIIGGLTFSVCILRAGKKLARYESRTFCLIIAAILCAFAPLGTVLGVFSIITLTKPETKELFGETA